MKLKSTVNLNRIDPLYLQDFETARLYHLKHGVEWIDTFKNVDVRGYTSKLVNLPVGQRYLLSGVEKLIPQDPNSDVDIFVFDDREWATPAGSQFPLKPETPTGDCFLYNGKPFIHIATYITEHNNGQTWIEIAHEKMHALVLLANLKGFKVPDVMDTYRENSNPDSLTGNFAEQWKLLNNFLTMQTKTYPNFNPKSDPLMVGVDSRVMDIAQKVRTMTGLPMRITSGLRTPEQNNLAGGVSNSAHLRGLALDFAVTDLTRQPFLRALLTCGTPVFIEDCPNHIHFDIDSSIHQMGVAIVSQNG